jgi:hypothetical protein
VGVAKKLIEGLSQKDASHIGKFVDTVLDMAIKHWGDEANSCLAQANKAGRSFDSGEDDSDEVQAYYTAFRNWLQLRMTRNKFNDWRHSTRQPPARREDEVL